MRIRHLVAALVVLALACAAARAENAEFFRQIREKEDPTTLLDGYRVALALIEQPYAKVGFEEARSKLIESGVIRERWKPDPQKKLTRGKVAYMLVKILKIKGGLTMRLFGPSERYALKELEFMELMDGGMTWRSVSGRELVAVLARADEYMQEQKAKNAKVNVRSVETPDGAPTEKLTEKEKEEIEAPAQSE